MEKNLKNDILQWDVNSWSKALNFWEKNTDWKNVQNALELGGREGGLSLWLSLKDIDVICSDFDKVEITAEPLHSKYEVVKRVSYENIDATNIPYENHFDLIIFKSIIGGIGKDDNIEKQRKVFTQIYKALKPGGVLLFAENLVASPIHQMLRKRFVNWGDSWRYVSIPEMKDFLKPFSSYRIKSTGVIATFGRTEKQRSLLALVDQTILNHISPKKWKYISYGFAKK